MGIHKRNTAEKGYSLYGTCSGQSGIEMRFPPSTSKVANY